MRFKSWRNLGAAFLLGSAIVGCQNTNPSGYPFGPAPTKGTQNPMAGPSTGQAPVAFPTGQSTGVPGNPGFAPGGGQTLVNGQPQAFSGLTPPGQPSLPIGSRPVPPNQTFDLTGGGQPRPVVVPMSPNQSFAPNQPTTFQAPGSFQPSLPGGQPVSTIQPVGNFQTTIPGGNMIVPPVNPNQVVQLPPPIAPTNTMPNIPSVNTMNVPGNFQGGAAFGNPQSSGFVR